MGFARRAPKWKRCGPRPHAFPDWCLNHGLAPHQTSVSNNTSGERRDIIVIGGSAGALEALRSLVGFLPPDLDAAIFLTLHVSSDYPSVLPILLRDVGPLPAFHPKDKEPIRAGSIYVAPPDLHLLIERGRVRTSRGPRENRHRPAVDPMFRTAARAYGARVAGVILSGQLDDGSAGLLAVKMAGGLTVVQDPAEAVCPEMPSRAIRYAGAEHVLRIAEIAKLIVSLSKATSPAAPSKEEELMADELTNEVNAANLESEPEKRTGKPSAFSCPECHGVLWELEEGEHLRFRCRVGHAYTASALRVALSESTEDALWAAMRVLKEKASLLRRMSARTAEHAAARYRDEAEGFENHAETIREILIENQNSLQEETEPAGAKPQAQV